MSEESETLKRLVESPSFRLYTLDFTVSLFSEERLKHFEELSKEVQRLHVYDFLKFGLLVIGESQAERVFLGYGLLKLFEEVCRANNRDSISFLDLTSYVVDKLPKLTQEVRIQEKLLPYGLEIAESVKRTLIAPQVYGKKYNALRRLQPEFTCCDHHQHLNRKIEKATYSPSCRQFVTMDSPSSQLLVFDAACQLFKKVETELQLANRQSIIISFAWSEYERRIGCILANYSSSFWSSTDEFRFELNVPLRRDFLKHPPIRIYYLECERKWLKFDAVPNIYSLSAADFDICDTFHHSKLRCENDDSLLVSEAAYHKLLILGFDRTILMISVERKEVVSEISSFRTNVYTLCFAEAYQVLLVGCFETHIYSYELSEFCDLTEKGRLSGHRSHITALAVLQNSPIILTIQDEGTMKLWDIRDLSCFQTLVAPSNIIFRSVLQMDEGVCLVGSKLFVYEYEERRQTYDHVTVLNMRMINNRLMVASSDAVSFFNIDTGRVSRIIKAIFQDEEITTCQYLPNQNMLLLVNPKGLMKGVDADNGGLVLEMQLPEGKPIRLRYEDHVKMLFYSSDEAITMYQHDSKRSTFELKREIRHHDDYIVIADGSCLHDLVAFTYGGNVVYFYTHERARALGSLLAPEPVVDLLFVAKHKLIALLSETSLAVMSYEVSYGTITTTVKYAIEDVWAGKAISARIWQNTNELFVASATGHLLIINNTFQGQSLGQELERNNYNPYRLGNQNHKESFKRFRPMLSRRGKEQLIEVEEMLHCHRRQIIGVVRYGQNLLSIDVEGSLRLVNNEGQVSGKTHLLNPLPEFWNNTKDKRTELQEMQFVLEMLEHLRQKNPKFAEYFAIDEFLQSLDHEAYITETIARLSRSSRRAPQQPVKVVAGVSALRQSEKIATSLRQKKIVVEKQREERRNQENYEQLVKLNAKAMSIKEVGESQREKDIINFFDESAIENIKKRGIKPPVNSIELKQFQQKLNALSRRSDERSFITGVLRGNKTTTTPIKLPTEAKLPPSTTPLQFYSTELVRDRSQPRNALDLVRSLKVSLLDSKFNRNSTSLPKLRSVSLKR